MLPSGTLLIPPTLLSPDVPHMNVLSISAQPSTLGAPPSFTGVVQITALVTRAGDPHLSAASTAFASGARTAWHCHPLGELMVATDGAGQVQQRGYPPQPISRGDIVWTPPGIDHWHGATPLTSLTHIAAHQTLDGPVHWKEPVINEQYSAQAEAVSCTAGSSAIEVFRLTPTTVAQPMPRFTGRVAISPQFNAPAPANTVVRTVTFECCSRTDWHTHPLGQLLLITAGSGLMQERGRRARRVVAGDVVWIPPAVEHWHGASQQSSMTHVGLVWSKDGKVVDWKEPVTDEEYNAEPE